MDQVQVRVISKVPVPQRIQEFRGQETGEPRELSAVVLSQIRIMDPGPKAVTSSNVTPSPGRLLRLTTQVHFVPIVSRLPCMCGRDRYGACAASRILSGEIRAGASSAREIIWSTSASDVTEQDPKQTDLIFSHPNSSLSRTSDPVRDGAYSMSHQLTTLHHCQEPQHQLQLQGLLADTDRR